MRASWGRLRAGEGVRVCGSLRSVWGHVGACARSPARTRTPPQTARKIHVAKFRAQKVHVLITTDVAARGIDIPLIDNVVNLDFPPKPELFVHRVGRAARWVRGACGEGVGGGCAWRALRAGC